jgi:hypothetical protein
MSLVVIFTVPFEPTVFRLLKVIDHFCGIRSKFSLWWPFGLAFHKMPFATPESVIQGKEPSMIIKEIDFLNALETSIHIGQES